MANNIDEKRFINAINEMFLALGTTPPDAAIEAMVLNMQGEHFRASTKGIVDQIHAQYMEIGNQLKEAITTEVKKMAEAHNNG